MKLELEIAERIYNDLVDEFRWNITEGDKQEFVQNYIIQMLKNIAISHEEAKVGKEAIKDIAGEINKLNAVEVGGIPR